MVFGEEDWVDIENFGTSKIIWLKAYENSPKIFRCMTPSGGYSPWRLVVATKEDPSCIRKDQAPEDFAILRHIAHNLLKQEKTADGGLCVKSHQAALIDCPHKIRASNDQMRLPCGRGLMPKVKCGYRG